MRVLLLTLEIFSSRLTITGKVCSGSPSWS